MVKDIETEANAAGYAWRLIRDAKDELRINPVRSPRNYCAKRDCHD